MWDDHSKRISSYTLGSLWAMIKRLVCLCAELDISNLVKIIATKIRERVRCLLRVYAVRKFGDGKRVLPFDHHFQVQMRILCMILIYIRVGGRMPSNPDIIKYITKLVNTVMYTLAYYNFLPLRWLWIM